MTAGKYEEKLPCGGTLRVSKSQWEIGYYFMGPDLRYNGTSVTVPGNSIDAYIKAFEENFEQYLKLQEIIPRDGDFSTSGKEGMSIRIGGYWRGVCIQSHYMPLATRADVQKVIDGYRYAEERAPKIQSFLALL